MRRIFISLPQPASRKSRVGSFANATRPCGAHPVRNNEFQRVFYCTIPVEFQQQIFIIFGCDHGMTAFRMQKNGVGETFIVRLTETEVEWVS